MDLIWVFILAVSVGVGLVVLLQGFIRWRTKKIEGKEITKFGKNVVLYLYSPKCGACQRMDPIIKSLAKKVRVQKIDISEKGGLEFARELGVMGTPTTVIIKDGKVHKVFVGFQKEEKILREVKT